MKLTNSPFEQGNLNTAYAQYFTGNSYLKGLLADSDLPFSVAQVTFEPGCRNNWHQHTEGGYQILLVTAGSGWYQEQGKPAQKLTPGSVVYTKENVVHWHGADKATPMAHIAITAGKAEWGKPVSDEEYETAMNGGIN